MILNKSNFLFIIITSCSIVLFIFYNWKITNTDLNFFKQSNLVNIIGYFEQNITCNIFTNETNQRFLIENKYYPHVVPLYHNKSIDLACLNKKSVKKKTILLWNKFNGMYVFKDKIF